MNSYKRTANAIALFILLLGVCGTAFAELKLASIFCDHLVLQQGVELQIWGTGEVGKTVEIRFAGQSHSVAVGNQGQWRTRLHPLAANATGETLQVSDGETDVVVNDVLVGEVWLAAGQSNMEMQVHKMVNAIPEIKSWIEAAHLPSIRFLRINDPVAGGRRSDFHNQVVWQVCNPETVKDFSAVAWVFARRLHQDLDVPVGIIDVSWGGKPIEPFIPAESFAAYPSLKDIKRLADEQRLDELSALPGGVVIRGPEGYPGAIYDARIRPIAGSGLSGFIWYQAESNCGGDRENPCGYHQKMQALTESWRHAWGNSNLPLYFVQLPNYHHESTGWTRMRDEQRRSLAIPNTGMAVTIDVGSEGDIHPPNKVDVGERLARLALHRDYQRDIIESGPLYQTHSISDRTVTVVFAHAENGLMIAEKTGLADPQELKKAQTIPQFELAGENGVWFPADARIDGRSIKVSSEKVLAPIEVRYACLPNPSGGLLYNRDGLPASPFCSKLDWLPWKPTALIDSDK